MENDKNFDKEARLVFSCGVANSLLKAGCIMLEVKPDRTNVETGKDRLVFVFKNDRLFQEEFARVKKEIADSRAAQEKADK